MPVHTLKLTNGAAHVAISFLQQGLKSIDDIYMGGMMSIKLKAAKKLPKRNEGESPDAHNERVEEWLEQPFGEIEVEEGERDALKTAVKTLAEAKQLVSNEWAMEIIGLLGLNKKQD